MQGPVALHQQPAFVNAQSLPVAEDATRALLALPMHPFLTPEAIRFVCTAML
jgi:dTDP-4-amino-4,6-dideoxygalactose transaminase